MEAAEKVLRAGLLRLGGAILGSLLAADRGHRGHWEAICDTPTLRHAAPDQGNPSSYPLVTTKLSHTRSRAGSRSMS